MRLDPNRLALFPDQNAAQHVRRFYLVLPNDPRFLDLFAELYEIACKPDPCDLVERCRVFRQKEAHGNRPYWKYKGDDDGFGFFTAETANIISQRYPDVDQCIAVIRREVINVDARD